MIYLSLIGIVLDMRSVGIQEQMRVSDYFALLEVVCEETFWRNREKEEIILFCNARNRSQ
jgi:hypothetical protein